IAPETVSIRTEPDQHVENPLRTRRSGERRDDFLGSEPLPLRVFLYGGLSHLREYHVINLPDLMLSQAHHSRRNLQHHFPRRRLIGWGWHRDGGPFADVANRQMIKPELVVGLLRRRRRRQNQVGVAGRLVE